jgi:hypothetical protein
MALPTLSPEQRADALLKAAAARVRRSEVKNSLKTGKSSLASVLEDAESDPVLAKIKVQTLLESMPGIGKIRAVQIRERLGIAETRRIGGLGDKQRAALQQEFGPELARM